MAWRDQLRPASFRGVPFFVAFVEGTHGRRYATHEYPGRDEPFLEDMGRRSRDRSIDAYVLEPGHIAKAKALVAACEQPGPGTLVHPWLGEMRVVCTECRQTFAAREAGVSSFLLAFSDAGEARYPSAARNAAASVDFGALELNEASIAEMNEKFTVRGLPDFVGADATEMMRGFGASVRESFGGLATLAEWQRGVSSLVINAANLVRSPSQAAQQVLAALDLGNLTGDIALTQALFDSAATTIDLFTGDRPLPSWRAYLPMLDWRPNLRGIPGGTAARLQETQNREIFAAFVRRSATVQAARLAAREVFPTYEDAIVARDVIAERLDVESQTASDDVYRTSVALRAAVVAAVSAAAPMLPRLVQFSPSRPLPALVIAHMIYGDDPLVVDERATEIVTRNRVRNPLAVPGGVPIRVRTK